MNRPLRFHWSLSQAGDTYRGLQAKDDMTGLLSFDAQLDLCRCAEISGIDSVLMAIGYTRPDPLLLSVALGRETEPAVLAEIEAALLALDDRAEADGSKPHAKMTGYDAGEPG